MHHIPNSEGQIPARNVSQNLEWNGRHATTRLRRSGRRAARPYPHGGCNMTQCHQTSWNPHNDATSSIRKTSSATIKSSSAPAAANLASREMAHFFHRLPSVQHGIPPLGRRVKTAHVTGLAATTASAAANRRRGVRDAAGVSRGRRVAVAAAAAAAAAPTADPSSSSASSPSDRDRARDRAVVASSEWAGGGVAGGARRVGSERSRARFLLPRAKAHVRSRFAPRWACAPARCVRRAPAVAASSPEGGG